MSSKELDKPISYYSSRFEDVFVETNRPEGAVRPLETLSDLVVNGLSGHYLRMQQKKVDARYIAGLYEKMVDHIKEQDFLVLGQDIRSSRIAHLDATMAEAVLVFGGVVPPANLTRLVDRLSEQTGCPPIVPYATYIENVHTDRRIFTGSQYGDEQVGRSEAKFQEIHRLIEINLASIFTTMTSSLAQLTIGTGKINSATEMLLNTKTQLIEVNEEVLTLLGLPKKDFASFRPPLSSSPIRVMDMEALPAEVRSNLTEMLLGLKPKELIPQNLLEYVKEIQSKGMMTLGGPSGAVSHGVAAITLLLGFGGDIYKKHVESILPYCLPEHRFILNGLLKSGVSFVQALESLGRPKQLKEAIDQIGGQMIAIRKSHQKVVAFHFEDNYGQAIGTFGRPVSKFLPAIREDTKPIF